MTREEAYKWNENSHDENFSTVREMEESIYYLLKRIYDSFEIQINEIKDEFSNRSCENCKYVSIDTLGLIYCASSKSPLSSCLFAIHPNFSCNKWESK